MPIPNKPSYTHGSTGTAPSSPINYATGDALEADELDYYVNEPLEKIKDIIDALNEIDSGTIVVGEATDASNVTDAYKSNDIDSDGDGRVNAADDATTIENRRIYVQSTEPSSPSADDIWIDTS